MRSIRVFLCGSGCVALLLGTAAHAATPRIDEVQTRLGITRLSIQSLRLDSPAPGPALDLDGRRVTLRLERSTLRAPGFRVLVQTETGALEEAPVPAAASYRGTVDGMPGSVVGGTIRNGQLRAAIGLADGRMFYVQPLEEFAPGSEPGAHVVYDAADVIGAEGTCATSEPSVVVPESGGFGTAGSGPHVAEISFDADYEFWQANVASVSGTIADIEDVMAAVNVIYERDCDLTHEIRTIIVRTAPSDPYSTTDASALLIQFRDHWNASQTGVIRDVAHLMTGKNLDGGTIGIAYLGAVCRLDRAYGLSESSFTNVMSWRSALTAHELGHNWNANHCDAVVPCNIMCSTINHCSGFGLPNFEPQAISSITSFAAGRTCLDTPRLAVGDALADGRVRFAPPTPSVFTGEAGATLRYYVEQGVTATLDIHDVAGHRVARLAAGAHAPGWHQVTWRGRDASGRPLRAGIYYARLGTPGAALTHTLVLLH
jgi:hypothetical protein